MWWSEGSSTWLSSEQFLYQSECWCQYTTVHSKHASSASVHYKTLARHAIILKCAHKAIRDYDSCMSLTVIVFTSITIVIHQNFTGTVSYWFALFSPYRLVRTSHFFLAVCWFRPIAAQVNVTHDDESTLVLGLLEPIEIALQCLQFKKKNLCMEVYGNTRGNSQSDRNHPKRGGVSIHIYIYIYIYI